MTTGDTAKAYKIISESFNFALDVVGMDKDSGQIWQEYINFIKTGPGIIGGTGWQDTQKMDALRAAYQKAIAVPTSALAPLWKEYDGFETGLSKINVQLSFPVLSLVANNCRAANFCKRSRQHI
jgi:cleavage stimulation factor subunit 3